MRAGPLSDARVISLLNRFFVPVYVVNEDYRGDGPAPPEERREVERIYRQALDAGMPAGTVHVYIVDTGGRAVDSLHVAEAARTERLIALLEKSAAKLKVKEGAPVVEPARQSVPPRSESGSLVLHLTARALSSGSWHEFPSEDWIVLSPSQWRKLLPPPAAGGPPAAGPAAFAVEREVAEVILKRFYPQTENNDVKTNRIERISLEAREVSRKEGVVRLRLSGSLRMKHAFYPGRDDGNFVEATLLGFLDCEPEAGRIRTLRLVTEKADYGKVPFAVAVRSVD